MKRVVLITGVAGGIGTATARTFADAGWHVIGVDRRQEDALTGVHRFIQADISDVDASRQIFGEVADHEGRIDALINNAAIQICKPLIDTTPEEWDAVMASNLRSVYLAIRHAYLLMRIHGGAIVNVSLCCQQGGVTCIDTGLGHRIGTGSNSRQCHPAGCGGHTYVACGPDSRTCRRGRLARPSG
jgi:NAD(P)-dependent dehydrogenase (short-subunit alcohol dehydrogenase family)